MFGFLFGIFYTFLTPLFGRMCDRTGSKKLVFIAALLSAAACLVLPSLRSIFLLFAFVSFYGVCAAVFWPCIEVWIAKNSKGNVLRAVGLFSVSWCAGISVGTLASGMVSAVSLTYPPYIGAAFCALAAVFTSMAKEDKAVSTYQRVNVSESKDDSLNHETSKPQNLETNNQTTSKPTNKLTNVFLKIAWMSNFMVWFVVGAIRFLFPKLAVDIGITPEILGFMLFTITASQAVTSYILCCSSWWHYKIAFLLAIEAAIAAGSLIFIFSSNNVLFFIGFALAGIGAGVAYFSSLYYSLNDASSKGSGTGIHESIVGSGSLLGPLIAGILAQNYTLRAPYLACIIVVVGVIVLQIVYYRLQR